MRAKRKRLGDLIVDAGLLTREQIEQVFLEKDKNQKLGDALIERGLISQRDLFQILKTQLGVSHMVLKEVQFDEAAIRLVPKKMAEKFRLVPIRIQGSVLQISMEDPLDFFAAEDLRLTTGYQVETFISTREEISAALNRIYGIDPDLQQLANQNVTQRVGERTEIGESDSSPIVTLVNRLISSAIKQRVSDVHIDPHAEEVFIRYRLDGTLFTNSKIPIALHSMLVARIKIISNLNITETRLPQDGRAKIRVDENDVDLRISTLPTVYGEKVVLRILDHSSTTFKLEHLGFSQDNHDRFKMLMEKPNGMLLITGPTGSGKTTTLYAALNVLNTERVNIITVEDPVEYRLDGINQVQINATIDLTFSTGLRSILRQDPDIIMIGEIRDRETAEISVRSALTGHTVFSTLHTNDAIGVISRLIDMGVEPYLLASSLNGVMAQRLVRKVCRDCKVEYIPSEFEREIFRHEGLPVPERLVRGSGCASCNQTGYRGRLAIHELISVSDELRVEILNYHESKNLNAVAKNDGAFRMVMDGLLKVSAEQTTVEEILRVVSIEQVV